MREPFIAFAVDIYGVAKARYDLAATTVEEASKEAREFLASHESLEVWQGARLVGRVTWRN